MLGVMIPALCSKFAPTSAHAYIEYHLSIYVYFHIKGAAYISRGLKVCMRVHNESKLFQNHLPRWLRCYCFNPDQRCSAGTIEPVKSGFIVQYDLYMPVPGSTTRNINV